jgi:hypothetical protein
VIFDTAVPIVDGVIPVSQVSATCLATASNGFAEMDSPGVELHSHG